MPSPQKTSPPTERRISVLVPEDLYQRMSKCFEWGERNRVLRMVLSWVCEKVEKGGKEALIIFLRDEDFDKLVNMKEKEQS